MWNPFRRKRENDEVINSVAGYSTPPTPEERLDMSMIAVALGDFALSQPEIPAKHRLAMEQMREEAKMRIDELLVTGVTAPSRSSPRENKIKSTIRKLILGFQGEA